MDIVSRFKCHQSVLRNNKHHNVHLQRAFNQCTDCFIYDVLELCDENQLDEREIFWITTLDSANHGVGYNIASGGLSSRSFVYLPEVREKQKKSYALYLANLTSEEKEYLIKKRRNARTYMPLTEDQKRKRREKNIGRVNPMVGKTHSDETKQKISEIKIQQHKSGVYHQERPVYQLDDYYQIIQFYPSISEAGVNVGINISGISSCLNGKLCRAGGYYWAYADQFDLNPKEYERLHRKKSHRERDVIHYSIDMERLEEYDSVTQMSNAINIDGSHLCKLFTKNGGIIVRAEGIFICNSDWR